MAINPADPAAALRTLAEAVDKLSGQLAAVIAYVATTAGPPLSDRDLRATQVLAQSLTPPELLHTAGSNPSLAASLAVERINSLAQQLQSIRSAGPGTTAQP